MKILPSILIAVFFVLTGYHNSAKASPDVPYMQTRSRDGRFGTYLKPHGRDTYDNNLYPFSKNVSDLYLVKLSPDGKVLKEMLIRESVPTPMELAAGYATELQIEWTYDNKRLVYRYQNFIQQELIGYVDLQTLKIVEQRLPMRVKRIKQPEEPAVLETMSIDGAYVAIQRNGYLSYYKLENMSLVPKDRRNQTLIAAYGTCITGYNSPYSACTYWGPVPYYVALGVEIRGENYLKIINLNGKAVTQTFRLRPDLSQFSGSQLHWSPTGRYVVVTVITAEKHHMSIDAYDIDGHIYQGIYENGEYGEGEFNTPIIRWCGADTLAFVDFTTHRYVRYYLPKGTYKYTMTLYEAYTGENSDVAPDPCK